MATLIKVAGTITPPSWVPVLPDIETGLNKIWRASSLLGVLEDGDTVNSWVAQGDGPLQDRNLNVAPGVWAKPTFSETAGFNGGPALTFNGRQQLRNVAGADPYAGPDTVAIRMRCTNYAKVNDAAKAFSDAVSPYVHNIGVLAGAIVASAGTRVSTGHAPTGWVVVIVVFNGADSIIKVSGYPIMTGVNLGAGTYRGAGVGGSGTTLSDGQNPGFEGAADELRYYHRALTVPDVEELAYDMTLLPAG